MQARVPRRSIERGAQHAHSLAIAIVLPVEIGEVDRRGRELRVEPQCSFVLRLRFRCAAATGEKIAEGRASLRPVGIEALGGNKFSGGMLEALAIGVRLPRGRNGG